jgi:HSP20 family protein
MFSLGHRMGNLFDELYNQTHRDNSERSAWRWDPMVDIYDNDENIVIKAELPGLDKKDIVVDVKENVLTLKGERSTTHEVKEENLKGSLPCPKTSILKK